MIRCPIPSNAAAGKDDRNLTGSNGQACFWFSNGQVQHHLHAVQHHLLSPQHLCSSSLPRLMQHTPLKTKISHADSLILSKAQQQPSCTVPLVVPLAVCLSQLTVLLSREYLRLCIDGAWCAAGARSAATSVTDPLEAPCLPSTAPRTPAPTQVPNPNLPYLACCILLLPSLSAFSMYRHSLVSLPSLAPLPS